MTYPMGDIERMTMIGNNRLKTLVCGLSLLLAAIYVESSLPPPKIFGEIEGLDKLAHFIVYGLLGGLIISVLTIVKDGKQTTNILVTTTLVLAAGIIDEFHQSFTPGRNVDGLDLLADTIGGLLFSILVQRFHGKTKEKSQTVDLKQQADTAANT